MAASNPQVYETPWGSLLNTTTPAQRIEHSALWNAMLQKCGHPSRIHYFDAITNEPLGSEEFDSGLMLVTKTLLEFSSHSSAHAAIMSGIYERWLRDGVSIAEVLGEAQSYMRFTGKNIVAEPIVRSPTRVAVLPRAPLPVAQATARPAFATPAPVVGLAPASPLDQTPEPQTTPWPVFSASIEQSSASVNGQALDAPDTPSPDESSNTSFEAPISNDTHSADPQWRRKVERTAGRPFLAHRHSRATGARIETIRYDSGLELLEACLRVYATNAELRNIADFVLNVYINQESIDPLHSLDAMFNYLPLSVDVFVSERVAPSSMFDFPLDPVLLELDATARTSGDPIISVGHVVHEVNATVDGVGEDDERKMVDLVSDDHNTYCF
jgi:hypothetical protein